MSFLVFDKTIIEVGDTVIIYVNTKTLYVQVMEEGKVFQTKFGALKHDSLIGTKYGQKYQCARGYVHILRPTPELWTMCLPHRTQILYFNDISLITQQLELRPGSVVIEAGTGSGSLTHCMARTVAPHGHIWTFDFHEIRVIEARKEFESHGLSDVVTVNQRDVCQTGFPTELTNKIDALFLDLPHPWEAIEIAKKMLKKNGRICCFSPCVEQVQKTAIALQEKKFTEICTLECLHRPFEVKQFVLNSFEGVISNEIPMETGNEVKTESTSKTYTSANPIVEVAGHTGFLTFATNFFL
ncbi:tRNA (adenine(58)-N(1))-methyltransferase catalytic subunit TRMT61A [Halotydeus destructor]|nr:tRNA (adenine(58)-N(1))-methyltransferase catalytic subunit TRMT61A [Halotydeus destructor]